MEKECLLTTFVFGGNYQAFVPLLVYSCKKAYPEYDIMLFIHGPLLPSVRRLLEQMNLIEQVTIRENVFNVSHRLSSVVAASYRWVLWDECFRNYKYLYVVDIDMFYIREPKPLHIQHSERMDMAGLPFDNLKRISIYRISMNGILRRIKYAHFNSFFSYLKKNEITQMRLTGLHFVDIKKFYTNKCLEYLNVIRTRLSRKVFFPEIMVANDEALLFKIVTDLGYDCSWLGCQTSPVEMLDFDNNLRKEFRPHHGIHIGMFKRQPYSEWSLERRKSLEPILQSHTYKFYIEQYKYIYYSDEFQKLLTCMPMNIREYILRLNDYYKIN